MKEIKPKKSDGERFWERSTGNLFDAAGVKRYGGR